MNLITIKKYCKENKITKSQLKEQGFERTALLNNGTHPKSVDELLSEFLKDKEFEIVVYQTHKHGWSPIYSVEVYTKQSAPQN